MGYRNKIGILDKSTHDEIKDMTHPQLIERYCKDGDDYAPCYDITDEVYEIGKYWDHDFLEKFTFPLFSNPETHCEYNDEGEFYGITREGFLSIIQNYHDKIAKYFNDLYEKKEDADEYFLSKKHEWDENPWKIRPYDLRDDRPEIVSSWKYEYSIFELVRIYKTIDWDKQIVTITGW